MFRLITGSISRTLLFWRPSFLTLKSPIVFLVVWSGSSEFSEVIISSTLWMVCCQDSVIFIWKKCWCFGFVVVVRSLSHALCGLIDCSTPGFPLLHYLPELAQTHIHWVSDAVQWSHILWSTISSSVIPFSSWPWSFPAPGSFLMSQFFVSGGQRIGASASASVLPMSIQCWFPLGMTGLISLLSKGLSRVLSSTPVWVLAFWKHWEDQDTIVTFGSTAYIFHMMISSI